MKAVILWFCALAALAVYPTQAQELPDYLSGKVDYFWPTNASDYMSATFGETRSAHFHAGIDIGTWGQEGFEVYAARDGELYRVGVSPYGYGNVIYLRHSDSTFTVYAHLQDFAPEIRALVDSVRFKDYRHSFDEVVLKHGISFKRGDKIGRTGSTGIGPPHLHFEIRSPSNKAVNPKLAGIHIPDSVPPVISSIAIEPLGVNALVRGRKSPYIRRTQRSDNTVDFGTIDASGRIGLSVNASDRSDNGRNVYAVYELKLEVNDELYFHSKADSLAMRDGRQMLIDRVFPLLRRGSGAFQRLYIRDGNTLPFYADTGRDGTLNLAPGLHDIKITTRDYYGNTTKATGKIRVTEEEAILVSRVDFFRQSGPSFINKRPDNDGLAYAFYWHKNWMAPAESTFNNLKIRSLDQFGYPIYVYDSVNAHQGISLSGSTIEIIADEFSPWRIYRIDPGSERTISYPVYGLKARFFENSVFDTVYVHLSRSGAVDNIRIHVTPLTEPLRNNYELEIRVPDELMDNPGVGLYQYNNRRRTYDYMQSEVDGNILTARVNSFGTFEVRQDTTPPVLSRPSIWRRRVDGQWFVTVRAYDLESGIDFNQIVFKVNGIRGIAEYDPFSDRIRYHNPGFEPKRGENIIELMVPDRAGNVTTEQFIITR